MRCFMEHKNIIIILVAIIVILAAVLGVMFLYTSNAKEPCKVKITSDKSQYEGDEKLSIQLTDLNKTPISKEKVNVIIKNKKGKVVVNKTVKTNSKGKAKLDLDLKKGKYAVNAIYVGNENYTGNDTTQKLTIKEVEITKIYPEYNSGLGYYRFTGISQDECAVLELSSGRYIIMAGDGYYEYGGLDSQGNIIMGTFLGHGGQVVL